MRPSVASMSFTSTEPVQRRWGQGQYPEDDDQDPTGVFKRLACVKQFASSCLLAFLEIWKIK